MTIIEKANAYDEALEKAKRLYEKGTITESLCYIFPELKESEDEKIRKGIIDFLWKEKIFLQEAHSSVENNPKYRFVMDAIDWLEKQGEQKLDTLEVKDVDLDNELDFVKDAYYYFTSDERSSMKKVAKHFFELGLKAQKGE